MSYLQGICDHNSSSSSTNKGANLGDPAILQGDVMSRYMGPVRGLLYGQCVVRVEVWPVRALYHYVFQVLLLRLLEQIRCATEAFIQKFKRTFHSILKNVMSSNTRWESSHFPLEQADGLEVRSLICGITAVCQAAIQCCVIDYFSVISRI